MQLQEMQHSAIFHPMVRRNSSSLPTHPNGLKYLMARDGLSQADIARAWGVENADATQRVHGRVRITPDRARILQQKFGWSLSEIYGEKENPAPMVQEVGYVGAGIVYAYDDYAKGNGIAEHPCPRGYENTDMVCVRVRGDSMLPMLKDGFLLFYSKKHDGVPDECISQTCVVKIGDDGMMVRDITKGSKPGLYHLTAFNASPMLDVKLEWAAKIIEYRPR